MEQSLDLEALVRQARRLWRDESYRVNTGRLELYVKVALRSRASRDLGGRGATLDRVFESGLAVRVLRSGQDRAGFAAAAGLSSAVARWVVHTASAHRVEAIALSPTHGHPVESERWDLDPLGSLPPADVLAEALVGRPNVHRLEAGTTAEIVIGPEGWLAARTRNRLWALNGGVAPRLIAQRGFSGWEPLLSAIVEAPRVVSRAARDEPEVLILTPEAAAPVVASLVDAFHTVEQRSETKCGPGWDVVDDPLRPDGLAGGTFDDAGFAAAPRTLAGNGVWADTLRGPGTLRRASYREPPVESASNLVVASGIPEAVPPKATIAQRCRVLPLTSDVWVLELDLADVGNTDGSPGSRRWIRVYPSTLISACKTSLGRTQVTAGGPIVPALVFEGLVTRAEVELRKR